MGLSREFHFFGTGFGLGHAAELFILGLQGGLLGLHLGLDRFVEFFGEFEVGDGHVGDVEGAFDILFPEGRVDEGFNRLLDLLFDHFALGHKLLGGEFRSDRFDRFLDGGIDDGHGDLLRRAHPLESQRGEVAVDRVGGGDIGRDNLQVT